MESAKKKHFEWLPNFLEAASRLKHLQDVEKVNRALNTIQTLDPVENFDELKDVVDTAERLGMNNDALSLARKRLNQVRDLIETKRNLLDGIQSMDKDVLIHAMQKAIEIRKEEPIFCDFEVAEAKKALRIIELEEKSYEKIITALKSGSASINDTGRIAIGTIRTKGLETCLKACEAKIFKTHRGQNVYNSGKIILAIRSAVVLNDWDNVGKYLDSCESDGKSLIVAEAQNEISCVLDAYQSGKAIQICKSSLIENCWGTFGYINVHECSISDMKKDFEIVEAMKCRTTEYERWKRIFGSFISIRKQVVVHEWDSVLPDIQSIGDDDSEILDTVLKDELRLLYDEAMNRIIIKNLSGLSVGRIEGYIGDLSLSTFLHQY